MDLQITTSNTTDSTFGSHLSKAWHIVSLLLSLRRPATPAELSFRCYLFRASPDYVEFLCFVPNSPILMAGNGFVTASRIVRAAIGEFVGRCGLRIGVGDVREGYFRKTKREGEEVVRAVRRRRSMSWLTHGDEEETRMCTRDGGDRRCVKVFDLPVAQSSTTTSAQQFFCILNELERHCLSTTIIKPAICCSGNGSRYEPKDLEVLFNYECSDSTRKIVAPSFHPGQLFLCSPAEKSKGTEAGIKNAMERAKNGSSCLFTPAEEVELSKQIVMNGVNDGLVCEALGYNRTQVDNMVDTNKKEVINAGVSERNAEILDYSVDIDHVLASSRDTFCHVDKDYSTDSDIALGTKHNDALVPSQDASTAVDSIAEQTKKLSSKVKNVNMMCCLENPSKPPRHAKSNINLTAQQLCHKVKTTIFMKHKSRHASKDNIILKEADHKDLPNSKTYPKFVSFFVEEEEGSGGYGTVYRVRRKSDGNIFAIKYPHANAHKNHVNNELKMLERFGGRNFVIKLEGSVRSGSSDCFVLQYVEHDRPEVLKREIDVFQLQWYGYCMFKALASLHKQGVAHRDVKPGNFLFSRKNCEGFLIDFNLAKDLHQYEGVDRSKAVHSNSYQHVPHPYSKSNSPSKHRMIVSGKSREALNGGAVKYVKAATEMKILEKKAVDKVKGRDDFGLRNSLGSQGADGSGLTSAKDVTSARTPSAERLREPLPCIGRKELINLAQAAMQSPNQEALVIPSSKRKRVAAPPGNMNKRPVYFTPMPLHSSGGIVCGVSLLKGGEGKQHKEGACVGTKGFRAPEVLLRSAHQGPKVDIWSAGVTLLYLMTGKLLFNGEPEQNMKEIVKLRGSEDLWEVAKLHNRESSFPMELFDAKFLPSVKLLDWCKANTKRWDFLEAVPSSVIDLIDKCLTVNPRVRLSAEEALQHEFFASCHEVLHKQRLLRQALRLDAKCCSSMTERGLIRSTQSSSPFDL